MPDYLSSSMHIKYLSELINTVKTSVELLGRKKRSGNYIITVTVKVTDKVLDRDIIFIIFCSVDLRGAHSFWVPPVGNWRSCLIVAMTLHFEMVVSARKGADLQRMGIIL